MSNQTTSPSAQTNGHNGLSKWTPTESEIGLDDTNAPKVVLKRHPDLIMIQDTPKGRGIFATARIPARTIVDVSPVLILDPEEVNMHIRSTRLWFYTYNWRSPATNTPTQALPLGLGSLFNHASARSRRQNTGFMRDFAKETITYITLRDIDAGEELCVCYGEDGRLGFTDADAAEDGEGMVAQKEGKEDSSEAEDDTLVGVVDIGVFVENS